MELIRCKVVVETFHTAPFFAVDVAPGTALEIALFPGKDEPSP